MLSGVGQYVKRWGTVCQAVGDGMFSGGGQDAEHWQTCSSCTSRADASMKRDTRFLLQ